MACSSLSAYHPRLQLPPPCCSELLTRDWQPSTGFSTTICSQEFDLKKAQVADVESVADIVLPLERGRAKEVEPSAVTRTIRNVTKGFTSTVRWRSVGRRRALARGVAGYVL